MKSFNKFSKSNLKNRQNNFNFLSHPLVKRFFVYIFTINEPVKKERFFWEAIAFSVLFISSWGFFKKPVFSGQPVGWLDSFLDRVNLIFHEAGHIFLMWAGTFMHAFGGTLLQCLIPLIVMGHFLRQKDNFAAGCMFWWFGQNWIDTAPYIYDAWDRTALLLGGVTGQSHPEGHDWYVLLNLMGQLENYAGIASAVNNLGKFFIILSLIWGFGILFKKFRSFKKLTNKEFIF